MRTGVRLMKHIYGWMQRKYRKSGLATKIVALLAVIVLAPAAAVTVFWVQREAGQVYEKAQLQCLAIVEQAAKDVAGNRSLIENTVLIALNQKDFLKFCSGDMSADGLSLVKFSQNELKGMRYIFQSNSLIDSASFYFYNEGLYEIWDTIYSYDRFENAGFAERLHEERGSIFLLDGITPKGRGYACCYHEVYLDTTCIGVLEIRMQAEDFLNKSGDIWTEEGGYTLLLDGEGRCLFTQPDGEVPDRDTLLAISRQFLEDVSKESFEVRTKEGWYYGAWQYLDGLDAYAVRCVEKQSLMGGIYRSVFMALGFVLLVLAAIYLIASLIYRRMLSRLNVLTSSMRQVQDGHLEVRVKAREDGDELDELGNHFNRMLSRMEGLITENVERETAAINAELNALQSQINSHFLYNALESIRMMAEVKSETEIADTIIALGGLLRYNMSWESRTVTLREEIASIERYIYFVNMIYEFDVQLKVRLEEEILDTEIPKLCLQPCVENSVVHGMAPESRQLHITVSAVENGKVLVLQVLDDGRGIERGLLNRLNAVLEGVSDENVRTGNSGIGIANVHKRLQMNYGREYGIVLHSEENAYTLIKVVMPYEKKKLGGW